LKELKVILVNKRINNNNQSITSLRDLLRDISSRPEAFSEDVEIIQALKSQGSLAKLSIKLMGIYQSSINTQKRIADNILEGGFEELDQLRKAAIMAVENLAYANKQPDKETRSGLLLTVAKLKSENQCLKEELLLLTLAFDKSLRQGVRYASQADASIQALCKKEQRELMDILSLRKHPINTNVVKLRED
jgi:hypothetical protein